jgi:hypothetical protein
MTIRDKFYMAGTEGTGAYVVPVVTDRGAVGYRSLGGNTYRVRVEPASAEAAASLAAAFPRAGGWKQPGDSGQNRFSTMVYAGLEALKGVIETAVKALKDGATTVESNLDAPTWASDLGKPESEARERAELTAQLKRLGFSGMNRRWGLHTLIGKVRDERQRLIAEVKRRRLPGANLARTWSTDVLYRKLVVSKRG